jgi:peptidoglycan-associated lipoprotein
MRGILFVLLSVLFFLISHQGMAQHRRTVKADKAFEMRQYSRALDHYKKAYNKVRKKDRKEASRILFQTAMCQRYLNRPREAEATFRRVVRANYPDPIAHYYLGEAYLQNAKYDLALEQFTKYKGAAPDDWRGQHGIEAVAVAQQLLENPGFYEVNFEKVFSSRQNDFAPAFGDPRNAMLLFTSSRDGAVGDKKDPWTGENYTSLFVSYLDRKGIWSNPAPLDEGPVNTEFNEGVPSVNASGTELFFTRCQSVPNIDMGCRIYMSKRSGATWGEPKEVVLVSDSTVSLGHPAISYDDMRLYFVADMPGGQGGKDIWYADRKSAGGDFGSPQNLGPVINTPGDDMFPSVRDDGTLYFSTNGRPGLGGLDIFFSQPDGRSWSVPQNMGTPVNSPGDDFGITFRKGANSGFFSSNRVERGTRGDVIYSFHVAPVDFTISGTVRDDSTKTALREVQVQLIGSDGSFVQVETNNSGVYTFDKDKIKPETKYDILVSKEKYFNVRGQESTVGIVRSRDFVNDFLLAPIPKQPIELPEILYDFASWELLPQYKDSLNGLVTTLKDNPGLVIELASHTDSRGSVAANDTLSQKRAQSVVDYLIAQGIDQRRLVAKGYGKSVPRNIDKAIIRQGFTFRAGTVLSETYINRLPNEAQRDVAHQLNRRTEFRVLRDDFKE